MAFSTRLRSPGPILSLRAHVVWLVLVCLLALLGFSIFVLGRFAEEQRQFGQEQVRAAGRGLASGLDLHLRHVEGVLKALSTSLPSEPSADLGRFYEQSREIAQGSDAWIVLVNEEGHPLFHTERPLGTPLPRFSTEADAREAIRSEKAVVTNLVRGSLSERPLFVVFVPVIRDGLKHALGMAITSESLSASLRLGTFSDWIVSIVDRQGIVVARNLEPEVRVGKLASASLREKMATAEEAQHIGNTVEGTEVHNFFTGSKLSGWTVALAIPTSVVDAPLWSSIKIFALGGVIFLLIGLAGAGSIGRRISQGVNAIALVAAALGKREPLPNVTSHFREVRQIVGSLEQASKALDESERQLREREASFELLFEGSPLPMWVVDRNTMQFLAVNNAACSRFGYTRAEFLNLSVLDVMGEQDTPEALEVVRRNDEYESDRVWRSRRADGSEIDLAIYFRAVTHRGREAILTAGTDVTEQKRAEETLRQATETLSAVIYASPVAIICLSIERTVLVWSHAAEQIFEYSAAEAVGRPYKLVPEGMEAEFDKLFERAMRGETLRGVHVQRRRKDGSLLHISFAGAAMYDAQGKIRGIAYALEDITERVLAEEALSRVAHFDQLTGLPNRYSFEVDLTASLSREPDAPASIALLDLDGFKEVNDTLGHGTGDDLLKEVASRCQGAAGPAKIYRLGGDEFVAVIPKSGDPREIVESVSAMLTSIAEPFDIQGHQIFLTASAGVAIAPGHGTEPEELLANADLAHYEAKALGRSGYRFFHPALRASAETRRALDVELRRALANGEFELHYQPQVRLSDGVVVGAEALLRWQHPQRGLLAPGSFIDVLDTSPIARKVGAWVLLEACREAARWQTSERALRVGVNLFGAQFHDEDFVTEVERALLETGLPAEALELEITENIALKHDEAMLEPLRKLRDKGVQVAFDDFGTGYASLSYLKRYPLSRIKIDRSFVKEITSDTGDAAIVRSLVVMAHHLGLQVIAEGIETEAQATILGDQQCEEGQGYLFSRPVPAAEFRAMVEDRSSHTLQEHHRLRA
jgi:diguanylate cyclase (GGDEF)-like protein/PAS domain S-box-containing protein